MRSQTTAPSFTSRSGESITITHTEYVADVHGTSDFNVNGMKVNPGNSVMFPWLSRMAGQWEKYRFKHLIFSYHPSVGTASGGAVMMAVDYDVTDALPATKAQLLAYQGASRAPIWQDCSTGNVAAGLDTQLRYIRFNPQASTEDPRMNDTGMFLIATDGSGTQIKGDLYVSYTVELAVPQTYTNDVPSTDIINIPSGTETVNPGQPFEQVSTTVKGPLSIDILDNNTLVFKDVGRYVLSWVANGTGFIGQQPNINFGPSVHSHGQSSGAAEGATQWIMRQIIDVVETAVGYTGTQTTPPASVWYDFSSILSPGGPAGPGLMQALGLMITKTSRIKRTQRTQFLTTPQELEEKTSGPKAPSYSGAVGGGMVFVNQTR